MASQQQVQVPPRYARVNAWVISRDTDAEVRWLAAVFGAVETPGSRMLDPDGDIGHVEVEIGDSVIMLFDAKPGWPPTPAHLRVYVGDVTAVHRWRAHPALTGGALEPRTCRVGGRRWSSAGRAGSVTRASRVRAASRPASKPALSTLVSQIDRSRAR